MSILFIRQGLWINNYNRFLFLHRLSLNSKFNTLWQLLETKWKKNYYWNASIKWDFILTRKKNIHQSIVLCNMFLFTSTQTRVNNKCSPFFSFAYLKPIMVNIGQTVEWYFEVGQIFFWEPYAAATQVLFVCGWLASWWWWLNIWTTIHSFYGIIYVCPIISFTFSFNMIFTIYC